MGKFMTMPKLDMSMEEGIIVDWMVKVGDTTERGDIVVEIETGKLSLEVDNPTADGVILALYAEPGDTIKVNEPIMYIGEEGEEPPAVEKSRPEAQDGAAALKTVETEDSTASKADPAAPGYDLAVVGGGPGGYVCAIRASQLGARVVLFEKDAIGGVCLNRGCIPTKALVRNAEAWQEVLNAAEMGISLSDPSFDWSKILARKDKVVHTLVSGVEGLLRKNNVEVISGEAAVSAGGKITSGGKTYAAANVVLATGTRPLEIPFENDGSVKVYNSAELLSIEKLPESIVIVGGGVIGVEMASIYAAFGVKVAVVEKLDSIIAMADAEVAELLTAELKKSGVDIKTSAGFKAVKGGRVLLDSGDAIEAEAVLIAVGRKPVTDSLGADAGVKLDAKGFIETDDSLKTSVDRIYAIGDITDRILLAHVASAQGIQVAEQLFDGKDAKVNYNAVPSCIFTKPEIAWVGMTEAEARAGGIPIKVGKFPFKAIGKALAAGDTEGFVKVIVDERWGEILGIHIIGPHAADLVSEAGAAIHLESTVEELASAVHAHPTLAEAVMEACEAVHGKAIHF
ncbi:MAG: dihydrolipoyl dehydrogenase [Spirochaetales bacterium]|uniref:Dihydrolipoyl dehydrogenase n=1 Tax=Candidatus Thalassospirochaeta sargassi TaxID=3119039 RepID=A0AAJ1IAF0_9SPIO|nr:dihydrolipoyl dehydrogenase [Spirochaetales bacterium]